MKRARFATVAGLVACLVVFVLLESGCGKSPTPVPTAPSPASSPAPTASMQTVRVWQGAFTTCSPPVIGCSSETENFVLRLSPNNDGLLQIQRANTDPDFAVSLSGSKKADGTFLLHGTAETHMLARGAAGTRTVDVQLSSLEPLQGSIAYIDISLIPRNDRGPIVFARELQVSPLGRFDGQWFGLLRLLSCAGACDSGVTIFETTVRPLTLTLADSGSAVTGDFNGLSVTGSVSGSSVTLNGHYQVTEPCPSNSYSDVVCSRDAELSLTAGALEQLEGTVTEREEYRDSGVRRSYAATYQLLGVARWP